MTEAVKHAVLAYHEIGEKAWSAYTVSEVQFREHLLACCLAAESQPRLSGAITFDDGDVSCYSSAFPILQRVAARATFFVVAGWMGARQESMSWPQVRELSAAGHEIGSHGMTHVFLSRCSDRQLEQEIAGSKRLIEDRLGQEISSISLPGGRGNARVLRACARAGYRRIYTSVPTRDVQILDGAEMVGRIMIKASFDAGKILRIVSGDRATWSSLAISHHAKRLLKRASGDRLYQLVWAWYSGRHSQLVEVESPRG